MQPTTRSQSFIWRLSAAFSFSIASIASNGAAAFNYWDVTDPAKTPPTLTATGAFASVPTGQLIAEAHPFDINTPLWSDGAHKARWVLLPPGKSIAFSERNDYWGYPDSTVFIKQFDIDTVPGDTTSRIRWETRFLINKREILDSSTMIPADHWYGFSYKWNAAQTDGTWVGKYSIPDSIRTYPIGKSAAVKIKKWVFPAEHCFNCHYSAQNDTIHTRSVLGFFTAQLNRPMPGKPGVNQLDSLFNLGVLTGAKPATWADSPRWRALDDSGASVNVRARSYIAANCSGCHGVRGNASSVAGGCRLNYDYHVMNDSLWEFRHHGTAIYSGIDTLLPLFYPVTDRGNNPNGLDSLRILPELVVPGYPQKSSLIMRQIARDTIPGNYDPIHDQMPPFDSYEVNLPAIALLSHWVTEMPGKAAPGASPEPAAIHALNGHVRAGLVVKGDRILVLPEGTKIGSKVVMSAVDGRNIALRSLGGNLYAVPASVPRGTYLIRIGNKAFKRLLP
ncbi:MAG: hypothetical protein ABI036_02150 [Fibrobacteria bacterium]